MLPAATPDYQARLCANLNSLRIDHGYVQKQLAAAVGVKRSTVGAWLEGRATPRLPELVKLARLFGLTMDELVTTPLADI